MPRLRTLRVTTTTGPEDILILDRLTPEEVRGLAPGNVPDGVRMLAFAFEVDLPEADADDAGAGVETGPPFGFSGGSGGSAEMSSHLPPDVTLAST
ncbi:hypothetical protein ACFOVU_16795 [Nocardiopsis sediminis]|uniref:FXSXX-COOH protein n=1 Tax=Nocardiopsis sediminis TaxID=1778267 RepID=A0ABV8FQB9_9ACTN